jgi:hypothetical protein
MSDFRREIEEYQAGLAGTARGALAEKESILRQRQELLQAKEASATAQAGQKFASKIATEGQKFLSGEALAGGLAPTVPVALKGLKAAAKYRSGTLSARWRTAQAQRYNARNNIPEDEQGDLPAEEVPELSAPDRVVSAANRTFRSLRNSRPQAPEGEQSPEDIPEQEGDIPMQEMPSRSMRNPQAESEMDERLQAGRGGELPEGAGEVQPGAEAGARPATLSDEEIKNLTGAESQAESQEASVRSQLAGEESQEAGLEGEAEDAVEDLAPEISAASDAWASVGGILGDLVPFVGVGLGIYGIVEAVKHGEESEKEMTEDPYASIRGKIQSAEQQMKSMNATISADQFASKIGAGPVPVGSLAIPAPDTSRQMIGVGSHF